MQGGGRGERGGGGGGTHAGCKPKTTSRGHRVQTTTLTIRTALLHIGFSIHILLFVLHPVGYNLCSTSCFLPPVVGVYNPLSSTSCAPHTHIPSSKHDNASSC